MGYTTQFKGELRFNRELTGDEQFLFCSMAGEDVRDHTEWELPADADFYYIDLKFTEDLQGITHNGAEKSYDVPGQVNFIMSMLRRLSPHLRLSGSLLAQGEEVGDIWRLVINDEGNAVRMEIAI